VPKVGTVGLLGAASLTSFHFSCALVNRVKQHSLAGSNHQPEQQINQRNKGVLQRL
jgi:hypothetical protein